MDISLLTSIDEQMKDVLDLKCVIQSIAKALETCINKETSEISKKTKKFLSSTQQKFAVLTAKTYTGKILKAYGDVVLNDIQYRGSYCITIKNEVLKDYLEYLSKVSTFKKNRAKINTMYNNIKNAKAKASQLKGQAFSTATENQEDVIGAGMDLDIMQAEFLQEARLLEKQLKEECINSKKLLSQISTLLHHESDYQRLSVDRVEAFLAQTKNITRTSNIVFGVSLTDHLQNENLKISRVINDCVLYLMNFGLNEPGIFRIHASELKVKKLTAIFDTDFSIHKQLLDNHIVSNTLKQYLLTLPEPLFTFNLYEKSAPINWTLHDAEKVCQMQTFLSELPKANYQNLKFLLSFFNQILSHSQSNQMDATHLSSVMGNYIARSKCSSRKGSFSQANNEQTKEFQLLFFLLTNFNSLFKKKIDLSELSYKQFSLSSDASSYRKESRTDSTLLCAPNHIDRLSDTLQSSDSIQTPVIPQLRSNEKVKAYEIACTLEESLSKKPPYHIINEKYFETHEKKF